MENCSTKISQHATTWKQKAQTKSANVRQGPPLTILLGLFRNKH